LGLETAGIEPLPTFSSFPPILQVYGLGADPRHPPVVHWGTPGHLLGTVAHVAEYLDIDFLRRIGLDFGLQYWGYSWRVAGVFPGLLRVIKACLGLSDMITTPDNAAYEMTLHAAEYYNQVRYWSNKQ